MKGRTLVIFLVLFSSFAAGSVLHEVEMDSNEVNFNTTLELSAEDPVNSWNVNYRLPDNIQVDYVEDSYGEISDYSFDGERISLETNSGNSRTSEYVKIHYSSNKFAEIIGADLYSREFNFAGYTDQESSGRIEAENIISGRTSYGFNTSYGDSMNFTGQGPVRATVNFGNGTQTSYYSFFGQDHSDIDLERLDNAYELALGTVRYQQSFDKFPVVVDSDYSGQEWSAGEYFQGRIILRPEEELLLVLAHEAVHGLNDRLLSWDNTDSAWFDEGVAKHVEDLARVKIDGRGRTSELFGEEVQYREGGYIYTLPPRGNREELWNYYQSNDDFMREWAPRKGNRDFGYYYSELIIKKHLYQNGTVEEIYEKVNPGRSVDSNEEKWSIYSEHLDLRPCDYESRERFDQCLDEIIDHEYDVIMAEPVENRDRVNVREVHIPEREPISRTLISFDNENILFVTFENLVDWFFEVLGI